MQQLSFLEPDRDHHTRDQGVDNRRIADLTGLLDTFRSLRLAEGAHPRSVEREASQIRALARECRAIGGPHELTDISADLQLVARVLCEPLTPIARSTGRARLIAIQRFIRVTSPLFGRDPDADLARLDALLPAKSSTDWHTAGTLVAGTRNRRRRRSPTLDTQDLHRILHAATRIGGGQTERNRALVALHCFSGLRPEEVVGLTWQQLQIVGQGEGYYALSVSISRQGRELHLPLPRQAAEPLAELAASQGESVVTLAGPVFRPYPASNRPLSYRAARDILRRACEHGGLPPVEAVDLRAAYAHWLRAHDLSDHEVAVVLGLERVRSVDRLLRRHRALDAQRRVREMLDN